VLLCVLLTGLFTGCAALTNPVANGIPVRRLPPELLMAPDREEMRTIPLSLLKQTPPEVYRLAANDVLGIYIDGVLPETWPNQPPSNPPVYFPSQFDPLSRGLPPAVGFPIPIQYNGTVSLPLIEPVPVQGKSIIEAEAAIRDAYLRKGILRAGRERIIVTLMQPRQTRVVVIRQEVGGFNTTAVAGLASYSTNKRGTGHVVNLRAYENDVLTALADTGGLPGLDAYDEIIIFKRAEGHGALVPMLESLPLGKSPLAVADLCPRVIQIPTRLPCGQPMPFRPEDVILDNGDVVFLEARDVDLFYTGGLLPAGEYALPRDHDLDVVEAVTLVKGTLINGAFGGNNLNGLLIQPGMGNPSPSLLTVLRRMPGGGQVPIRVDLNRALRDPRERIKVQAGDVLILQETPGEAVARYFTQAIKSGSTNGTANLTVP
jgi:protein involved in polysaccharide export with SLBB domain